ncbi:DUF1648 domain-containing protein [Paenibacillus sepulcri]|uniref:DUF1648 domain-containing protein n=1 Tax=Paenibacillus sepulcri TaxID=359917 RepID=A0ABS7CAU2_9BACL|nr:DUF1648 domain-containing protein [Paenibacillus sepulcri]
MDPTWGIWLFSIVMYVMMGIVFMLVPLISTRVLLFGVFVPEPMRDDEAVTAVRKSYIRMSVFIMVCAAAAGGLVGWWMKGMSEAVLLSATLVQVIGFVLSLAASHRRALRIKLEKGWEPPQSTKRVANLNFRKGPLTIRDRWYLVHLLLIIISVIGAAVQWDSIPDTLTTHYNASFEADGFSEKSFSSVFMMNITQLLLIGIFLFTNFVIRAAKQQLDPAKPDESMIKQQKFRRINSIFLYFLSLFIVALFSYIQATILYGWSAELLMLTSLFLPLILIGCSIGLIIYLRSKGIDQVLAAGVSDDSHWKGGFFYHNPEDPSFIVNKRYGMGWTFNMAHPVSWVVLGGILLILLVIVLITSILDT